MFDAEAPTPTSKFPVNDTLPVADTLFANKLSVSDFVYESGIVVVLVVVRLRL